MSSSEGLTKITAEVHDTDVEGDVTHSISTVDPSGDTAASPPSPGLFDETTILQASDGLTPADTGSFRDYLSTHFGFDEASVWLKDDGTLMHESTRRESADAERAGLKRLEDDLKIGEVIGRGGMGEVFEARQVSLDRAVAVKVATDDAAAARALIFEARVIGQLAHPNIVPVHALGLGDGGEVLLVMKRVEGVEWLDILHSRASANDQLDRHLDIFVDVCRAMELAHERGVVHRDLKPANVMVGKFGEVYLLDWGLAVAIDGSAAGHDLPLAREVVEVVGTPSYMAPEQVSPHLEIDARSDVFALGALLFEVVTGSPLYAGKKLIKVLRAALECAPPAFPEEVPRQMQAVLQRALAKNKDARFQSVRALREAVEAFRANEGARRLTHEAERRLRHLRETEDPGARAAIFAEARFGFQQALEMSPGDADARAGLDRIDNKSAREGHEVKRLRRFAWQSDSRVGRAPRSVSIILAGLCWATANVLAFALASTSKETYLAFAVGLASAAAIMTAGFIQRRVSGQTNRVDALYTQVTIFWILEYLAIVGLCAWQEVSVVIVLAIGYLNIGILMLLMALSSDRRLVWAGPVMALLVVPLLLFPDAAILINGCVTGGAVVALGMMLRKKAMRGER